MLLYMAAYFPNNVTTAHIQQYLDENKSLILKIVESQNSGKISECAENQARLQRNLMYLAAIADSQPQPPPTMHSQFPPSGAMQAGSSNYVMQQNQQIMTPQALMAARSTMLYTQQHPYSSLQQQQQQQAFHSHLGMSSGGSGAGSSHGGLHHMLQSENSGAGGSSGTLGGFPDFGSGSKLQDMGGSDGRGGSSSGGHGGDGGETLYLKSSEDGI